MILTIFIVSDKFYFRTFIKTYAILSKSSVAQVIWSIATWKSEVYSSESRSLF